MTRYLIVLALLLGLMMPLHDAIAQDSTASLRTLKSRHDDLEQRFEVLVDSLEALHQRYDGLHDQLNVTDQDLEASLDEKTGSLDGAISRLRGSLVREVGSLNSTIRDLGENNCGKTDWISRSPLINIASCPAGDYLKGLDFKHTGGKDLAFQMSYRIQCCRLKK